jgi:hypothetical protein
MKILLYLLTVIFAALGALSLMRTIERLLTGAGVLPVQILLAVIMLILAWQCAKKARRKSDAV